MFENITIIGCGLIGSSILRAITKNKITENLTIYDKSKEVMSYLKKQNLGVNMDARASVDLIQMPDMCLGGKIAAAVGDIICITADDIHQPISRITKGLQIPRFVHVAIIVGPIKRNGATNSLQRHRHVSRHRGRLTQADILGIQ